MSIILFNIACTFVDATGFNLLISNCVYLRRSKQAYLPKSENHTYIHPVKKGQRKSERLVCMLIISEKVEDSHV